MSRVGWFESRRWRRLEARARFPAPVTGGSERTGLDMISGVRETEVELKRRGVRTSRLQNAPFIWQQRRAMMALAP